MSFKRKSLRCVFPVLTHLYVLPVFKGTVSVREHAELSLADKQERDYHAGNQQLQNPVNTFSLYISSLTFHLCAILTGFSCDDTTHMRLTPTRSAHMNADAPTQENTVGHKCFHMQGSKNSLRSDIKNRPGK